MDEFACETRAAVEFDLLHDAASLLAQLDVADGALAPPPHVRAWLDDFMTMCVQRIERSPLQ